MGKIIYFIACIVHPIRIRNFRKMSIFLAMLIFVLEFFMVLLPSKLVINDKTEYTASVTENTYALYNIKDTNNKNGFSHIKETNFKTVDGKLVIDKKDVLIEEYNYYYDEENINVILIFDTDGALDKEFGKVYDRYFELYPDELVDSDDEDDRVNLLSQVAYYDYINSDNAKTIDEYINKYHSYTQDELNNIFNNHYYEYYGIDIKSSNKNYAYIFDIASIIRYTPDDFDLFDYEYIDIDVNDYDNINDFCKELSLQMTVKYNEKLFDIYLIYVLIYVLVLPLVATFIIYLFTHRFKKLDGFLEYYKIASLASIIPAICACIMSFVFGPGAKSVYMVLFVLYSLLMLYKASTMEEEKIIEKVK